MTPPGLFWVALAITFLILKGLMFRLSIRTVPQLLAAIFIVAMALDFAQWVLIRMVVEIPVGSWATFGGIILSAVFQTVLGAFFVKPFLGLVAHK